MVKRNVGLVFYISIFLIVEFIFGFFILETRSIFLDNTVQTGEYLAQSYVDKIETRLSEYAFAVELAGQYLDEMNQSGSTDVSMQRWLKSYCDKIAAKFGENILDFYAVVDETMVAANPWEGDADYDFGSTQWYVDALAAKPGTIVFSDLYTDAVTGREVFTLSCAFGNPRNDVVAMDVIALDVYLTSENWMGFTELPAGYGIFVYDTQHAPAYSMGRTQFIEFPAEEYAALAQDGETHSISYERAKDNNYNLFLCALENGWSVVVAIPSENLVSKEHMLLMDIGLWLNIVNMAIVIVFLIKNELSKKKHNQDTLTGLLNKSYFTRCVKRKMRKTDGVLLMIDLDNFKSVNDNYGHDHGDKVLRQVAELLNCAFRKTDFVGRFGGDEFIVYVDTTLPDSVLRKKAHDLLQQIEALAQLYPMSSLSVSIGGSRSQKGDKYSDVFKRADEALYTVKGSGKNAYAMYKQEA